MAARQKSLTGGNGLQLPQRQRSYGFSMTAMADMLFQLLIFFMLSASLASFAMLDIRTGTLAGSGGNGGTTTNENVSTGLSPVHSTAVWTLHPDALVASGQRFPLDRIETLARALSEQGTANVLIVLRPDVPVANVIAVLEVLRAHGIDAVQLADGGAA
ncbi:biopolymer transporter ExbD [Paracoccus caeni]|uniref:Biopolymer transporter ExbD n=1 Tax=Paracoccus caeni TaxID=657651 RepID=A0A934S9P9_9RHOB|nr:biopolymer transporter ExbD [Paracoccus caeni]MBK4214955.1 biopolymer transporter ExbD [Paracoccus caeni]